MMNMQIAYLVLTAREHFKNARRARLRGMKRSALMEYGYGANLRRWALEQAVTK